MNINKQNEQIKDIFNDTYLLWSQYRDKELERSSSEWNGLYKKIADLLEKHGDDMLCNFILMYFLDVLEGRCRKLEKEKQNDEN